MKMAADAREDEEGKKIRLKLQSMFRVMKIQTSA